MDSKKINLKNDSKMVVEKDFTIGFARFINPETDEAWMYLGIVLRSGEKYHFTTDSKKIVDVLYNVYKNLGIIPDDYDMLIVRTRSKNSDGFQIVDPYYRCNILRVQELRFLTSI